MHEFANQIARRGMHSPADEFLVTEAGERYTYGEFDAVTNRVANGLSDLGGSRGATIGVLMGNTAEHLLTVAGGLRRGCTVVPLNFRGGADEIARQIKHDEIEILAVSAHYRDVLRQIRSDIEVDTILYSGDGDEAGMGISYEAVIEDASTDPMRPLIEPTQTAMIFHTGGTTGVPKSVPWRPGHVEAHAKKLALEAGVTGDDSILIVTPLFHIASSMMGVYMAPFAGARIVML